MIEVGEYARNKEGKIFKIIDMYYSCIKNIDNEYIETTCVLTDIGYINKDEIVKHSKNIIDLIEVGDYVNGQKVIETDNCKGAMREVYVEGQNPEKDCGFYFEQIETVVTKEQFANIEYRLEENK